MVKIIELIQGSEKWLEFRKTKIMASDIPIILGISPYNTPYGLWLEKTGRKGPKKATQAMTYGLAKEDAGRQIAAAELGVVFKPQVVESDSAPIAAASLDGLSFDLSQAVEIKVVNKLDWQEIAITYEPLKFHYMQIQWQLYVTGLNVINCIYLNPMDDNYLILGIKRDENAIKECRLAAVDFYDCIINNTPPEIKEEDRIYIEDKEFHLLEDKYIEAVAVLEAAEERVKELRLKLIDLTDDGNVEGKRLTITKTFRKGNVDYKAYLNDKNIKEEELESYRKEGQYNFYIKLKSD